LLGIGLAKVTAEYAIEGGEDITGGSGVGIAAIEAVGGIPLAIPTTSFIRDDLIHRIRVPISIHGLISSSPHINCTRGKGVGHYITPTGNKTG